VEDSRIDDTTQEDKLKTSSSLETSLTLWWQDVFVKHKVFPARMYGRKENPVQKIKVFLLRELNKTQTRSYGMWLLILPVKSS